MANQNPLRAQSRITDLIIVTATALLTVGLIGCSKVSFDSTQTPQPPKSPVVVPVPTPAAVTPTLPVSFPAPTATPTPLPPQVQCPQAGCKVENGVKVCDVAPGQSISFSASAEYPSGMPSLLPAMGIGAPLLGYFPADYPITCVPQLGQNAIGFGNSGAGGKICEVSFNNSFMQNSLGSATYTLLISSSAQVSAQMFAVGYTCNHGCMPQDNGFYIRVSCQN
jgi:hypothetical protein